MYAIETEPKQIIIKCSGCVDNYYSKIPGFFVSFLGRYRKIKTAFQWSTYCCLQSSWGYQETPLSACLWLILLFCSERAIYLILCSIIELWQK